MREPQRRQSGCERGPDRGPGPGLLGRRPVIAAGRRSRRRARARPVEVDLEAIDRLRRSSAAAGQPRRRSAGTRRSSSESVSTEGATVEERAEGGRARLTGVCIEGGSERMRCDQIPLVGLVDRPFEGAVARVAWRDRSGCAWAVVTGMPRTSVTSVASQRPAMDGDAPAFDECVPGGHREFDGPSAVSSADFQQRSRHSSH